MALVTFQFVEKQVGQITFNDPDRLNAMGEEMANEFRDLVTGLKRESELRVLILTGAGRAFSAGGDLAMLERKSKLSGEVNRVKMLEYYHSYLSIRELGVPLIAAINGHAIGAGLCLAAACDIRIASDKAKFGLTFTRLGLHPGMGATYLAPRVFGQAVANLLMLTGRTIEAAEALRLGIVSELMATEKVVKGAIEIAKEILQCGPEATKQLLNSLRTGAVSLEAALEREALTQGINYAGAELREGVRAVTEKRAAKF